MLISTQIILKSMTFRFVNVLAKVKKKFIILFAECYDFRQYAIIFNLTERNRKRARFFK